VKGSTSIKILAGCVLIGMIAFSASLFFSERVSNDAIGSARAAVSEYLNLHPNEEPPHYLAVVDYTRPSFRKRMVIIDMATGAESWYHIAHAKKTGTTHARFFSNIKGSNMSSLGLFKTGISYLGDHGLAIRLHGLDSLKNSNAFTRDIVLHSAEYVSVPIIIENILTLNGPRLGRSNGCFVVNPSKIQEVVQKLSRGGFIYAYGEEGLGKKRDKSQESRDERIFLQSFPCLTRESIRIAVTAWMPDHPVK